MFEKLFGGGGVDVVSAREMVADGDAVLVDVRTRQEWKEGHAPEAMHVSLASLETQMRRIPDDAVVLAICRSGNRSARAVSMLRASGRQARNVKGGMRAWARADLPVTRKR